MSEPRRVFIDANVFVTSWTLDVLLTLADARLLEPRWSDKVIEEARVAVKRLGGPRRKGRYIDAAESAYPYACGPVEDADFGGIVLPDPDDRHVVTGAKAVGCDAIVTYNLKDFPEAALGPLGIKAIHPDSLLMELTDSNPEAVIAAVRLLITSKRHPPRSMAEEVAGLRANMLPRFAAFVEGRVDVGE